MTENELKLIQKIIRAKILLGDIAVPHSVHCASGDDTYLPVACICGADKTNEPIRRALKELDLTDMVDK